MILLLACLSIKADILFIAVIKQKPLKTSKVLKATVSILQVSKLRVFN